MQSDHKQSMRNTKQTTRSRTRVGKGEKRASPPRKVRKALRAANDVHPDRCTESLVWAIADSNRKRARRMTITRIGLADATFRGNEGRRCQWRWRRAAPGPRVHTAIPESSSINAAGLDSSSCPFKWPVRRSFLHRLHRCWSFFRLYRK